MDFIVGGAFQGKGEYVRETYPFQEKQFLYGETVSIERLGQNEITEERMARWCQETFTGKKVLVSLHGLLRRLLELPDGFEYFAQLMDYITDESAIEVVTSDEIGCGVVPMDAFERRYREVAGRQNCMLARRAEKVIRIYLGIPQIIKNTAWD